MPKSFYICTFEKFSELENSIEYQLNIENYNDPISTYFETVNPVKIISGFKKYIAFHETVVRKVGRTNGVHFNEYIESIKFNFFVSTSLKLIIFSVKKDYAKEFVSIFNTYKKFNIQPLNIDLNEIIKKVPSITGAWFSKLNAPNLDAAAYYGNGVNKSKNFSESNKKGILSNIQLFYAPSPNSFEYKIAISKKSSIVLMNKFENEESELDYILSIYRTFLQKMATIPQS